MNDKIEKKILKFFKNKKNKNNIPVIAFIVDENLNIISTGINNKHTKFLVSGHAEINAINKGFKKLKKVNLSNKILISTMEPCMMCLGAIIHSGIKKIFFYVKNEKFGYLESNHTFDISSLKIQKIHNLNINSLIKNKLNLFFKKLK